MKYPQPAPRPQRADPGCADDRAAATTTPAGVEPAVLSAAEIADWSPFTTLPAPALRKLALRQRLAESHCATPGQAGGRRWAMGCVSLEITQRCNLDCTLCYLSENAEAVRDLPLVEIFRRIDMIHAHYGPGTDVQVSGGEPTLRKREELLAIVARIAELGMRPALFTNGIRATRALLTELAEVGLCDVAFHVDITQQRAGYADEIALNAVRESYIERARGLPLMVIFNTTVCAGRSHALFCSPRRRCGFCFVSVAGRYRPRRAARTRTDHLDRHHHREDPGGQWRPS
jgi:7,8-dihydro-6-hydroxymethylpterin dimethyltransferase